MPATMFLIFFVVVLIPTLIIMVVLAAFFKLWLRARLSGASVDFTQLVGMKLRLVNPSVVVDSRIMAVKAGVDVSLAQLETHYLARGNIVRMVRALSIARQAGLDLTFEQAAAIDLAGRDVVATVQSAIEPWDLACPDPNQGAETVVAATQDGVQVQARARVTVRTNLATVVGGAGEETLVARVTDGLKTAIRSVQTHELARQNPHLIANALRESGLDAGTAFEILAINVDVIV